MTRCGFKISVLRYLPRCRFCGLKISVFGIVLSAWGMIQLSLMALAFYYNNIALIKDLSLDDEKLFLDARGNITKVRDTLNTKYEEQALNCGIAAGLYALTLLVSLHQFWTNNL